MELGSVHRVAIGAILLLAWVWTRGDQSFAASVSRFGALVYLVGYLLYVLVTMLRTRPRIDTWEHDDHPELWDRDLDG